MAGRPHYTQSEHAGMYHTWDEKGQGGSMSGLAQAQRFVKGRETTLKRVKTQARQRAAQGTSTMKMPVRGADRRKVPRYAAPERRITSQQQHAMLIQQIRRDLEAANAKNRALRAAAKKVRN